MELHRTHEVPVGRAVKVFRKVLAHLLSESDELSVVFAFTIGEGRLRYAEHRTGNADGQAQTEQDRTHSFRVVFR